VAGRARPWSLRAWEKQLCRQITRKSWLKVASPYGLTQKISAGFLRTVLAHQTRLWKCASAAPELDSGRARHCIKLDRQLRHHRRRAKSANGGPADSGHARRRADAAEVQGTTREPIRKPPRKRRPKSNLAAVWLHQFDELDLVYVEERIDDETRSLGRFALSELTKEKVEQLLIEFVGRIAAMC
jgi:hypothetical protein